MRDLRVLKERLKQLRDELDWEQMTLEHNINKRKKAEKEGKFDEVANKTKDIILANEYIVALKQGVTTLEEQINTQTTH